MATVPPVLREKLGDEGVEALLAVIATSQAQAHRELVAAIGERFEQRLALTEERFERRLGEEIARVNERITLEIGKVNDRITEEVAKINERITAEVGLVREKMEAVRGSLVRWMFVFWASQVGLIVGLILALTR